MLYEQSLHDVQEDIRENLESRGAQKRLNSKMRIFSNASQRADPKKFMGLPIPGAMSTNQSLNFGLASNSVRNKSTVYVPINRYNN